MGDSDNKAVVTVDICFNCDSHVYMKFLCRDCWRMLLLANAMGGAIMETFHKLLQAVMGA